ncbi:hypothetical protein GETHLI_14620 [Geothrix limicola]|uniref:Uncharacterized protein n=1 Tax=Geothrix limicola TaxID=2927978 RepID=A0ABQ5QEV3_9BACT|nr:hypothetical protein [Geothrix limicola]GLH72960.1 hypothetical protein GETHLI_14620 [Geothrix limicola]
MSSRPAPFILLLALGLGLNHGLDAQEAPRAQAPLQGKLGLGTLPRPSLNGFQTVLLRKESHLGSPLDPGFRLSPRGWQELSLKTRPPLKLPARKGPGEATVEVWDRPLPELPKEQAFLSNLDRMKRRLTLALQAPPPRHGDLDLAHLMLADPAQPHTLELAKVRSVHLRFNRLPPNRSLPR